MAKPAKRVWATVQIPEETLARIKALLAAGTSDHASVSEFVRDAVRRRLDELDVQRRAGDLSKKLEALGPDVDRASAKLGKRFCHKCGTQLLPGAVFCASCGTKAA